MQDGEDGKLLVIAQEDYLHSIAVDLIRGSILLDYEALEVNEGNINIKNPKNIIFICDETNIGADLFHTKKTTPDKDGNFNNTYTPLKWRPIWFTRWTLSSVGTIAVKVIGAQTTLPEEFGGKNLKKLISLFPDGRIGID